MKKSVVTSLAALTMGLSAPAFSDALTDAITSGKVSGDLRLRFENVEQDDADLDATALTLRTFLGYTTGEVSGFSAMVEMEDSRVVGSVNDYSVPPTGFKTGEYSVIADPETTELDQAYVQYKKSMVTAKVGRQVITYDGHRFVGHVGWRQDRQTFDAARIDLAPADGVNLSYAYVTKHNRIFAEAADQNAKDHLINASAKTPLGKLAAYAYLLEDDKTGNTLDTYGVSLDGSVDLSSVKVLYALEYATQEADAGAVDADADYMMGSLGVAVSGITAKLGYEVLGSDDGAYGFSTPLATLHKFNGWADIFLGTPGVGLVDSSATLSGSLLGGGWTVGYHDFTADESSATLDDLGTELDVSYAHKFGKNYNAGIKYASYSADDFGTDTDKFWMWVGLTF